MKKPKSKEKAKSYLEILAVLKELHGLYPSYNIANHLATALEEYNDIWGVPDSEVLYCLQKYKATLEYNNLPRETSEEELNKIIEDGLNLEKDFYEGQEY